MQLMHRRYQTPGTCACNTATPSNAIYTGRLVCRSAAAPVNGPISKAADPNQAEATYRDHIEAQAAYHASIQQLVGASHPPGADVTTTSDRPLEIARLALMQSTSQRRFGRTHPNTLNLSEMADSMPSSGSQQLPLSQLAFKVLLRSSLAAARLNHPFITTLHICLGLLSTAANIPNSPLQLAAGRYAAAEAAVTAIIDGPKHRVPPTVGAAVSILGQSRGLDVVAWCRDLSDKSWEVLEVAEQLRQQNGHPLITSNHLLAALLQGAPTAHGSSSSSHIHALFKQLDLDAQQIKEQLQQQQVPAAAAGEDTVACEPVGFLHEEFYQSLQRSGSPPTTVTTYCLN